jgi:glycosyltransferase involved in cell wall biosynthesis
MINLHIVRNSVTYDSRVLKETESIQNANLFKQVEICAFQDKNDDAQYDNFQGRKIWRVTLKTKELPKDLLSQLVKYCEWHWRIIKTYGHQPIAVIHCHDLEPLPIAVHLKLLTGARLIYDAHELETERAGTHGIRKWMAEVVERLMIRWVDAMITVSPSIQQWYQNKYPLLSCSLVRNIPKRITSHAESKNLRDILGINGEVLLFIYLGGLSKGRGIEKMLSAFKDPRVCHHLLIMGSGPLYSEVQLAVTACSRIHYLNTVPPSQVLAYTMGANIGISLVEDIALSYRYCLPNKLFEYLVSGLPVLVSDLTDQKALVEHYQAGWVTDTNPQSIVDVLSWISREKYEQLKSGLYERTQNLDWEYESEQLLKIYRNQLADNQQNLVTEIEK